MPMNDEEFFKSLYGPAGKPPPEKTPSRESDLGPSQRTLHGVYQGLLDLPETGAYYAEKIGGAANPNFRVAPQGLRDWARRYAKDVESTPEGRAGRLGGGLLTGAGEVGLAAGGLRLAGRTLGPASRVALGAMQGIMSRPATSLDQLAAQGIAGGVTGGLAAPVAQITGIPIHVLHWMRAMPLATRHALTRFLLSATGSVPTAAGEMAGSSVAGEERQSK